MSFSYFVFRAIYFSVFHGEVFRQMLDTVPNLFYRNFFFINISLGFL